MQKNGEKKEEHHKKKAEHHETHRKRRNPVLKFLATYAWSFALIFVAVSVLGYFGLLSSQKYSQERCALSEGISCLSHQISQGKISLLLKNNIGEEIVVEEITISDSRGNDLCKREFSSTLADSRTGTFEIVQCSPAEKFRGAVLITFTDSSGAERTRTGEISGTRR